MTRGHPAIRQSRSKIRAGPMAAAGDGRESPLGVVPESSNTDLARRTPETRGASSCPVCCSRSSRPRVAMTLWRGLSVHPAVLNDLEVGAWSGRSLCEIHWRPRG